jgi:hypothetical protein
MRGARLLAAKLPRAAPGLAGQGGTAMRRARAIKAPTARVVRPPVSKAACHRLCPKSPPSEAVAPLSERTAVAVRVRLTTSPPGRAPPHHR